ncbi:deoxyribose-phosphate aldolase [Thermovibrio sp.]
MEDVKSFLSKIDYSVLKATTVKAKVLEAAEYTKEFGFATLCVFPKHVSTARLVLPRERVCSVIGFPLSTVPTEFKLSEVSFSLEEGAGELDVVVDLSAVKEGDWGKVERELLTIRNETSEAVLKLIMECCYLTEEEKKTLCRLAAECGWDFVKTSTGYGPYGATVSEVEFLKELCGSKVKIKASGGIRSVEEVKALVEAGADRIGTSSGVEIARALLHGG